MSEISDRPRATEDELDSTMGAGGTIFRENEEHRGDREETPDYAKNCKVPNREEAAGDVRDDACHVLEFPTDEAEAAEG